MAVLVTLRISGDAGRIEQALKSDPNRLQEIAERAKSKGALHHRFHANVDGSGVLVVDEWETAEGFQQFFAENPDIGAMMAEAGVTSEPEASFWQLLDTPDAF
jgi:heme-degrading monooxygenase HmoA